MSPGTAPWRVLLVSGALLAACVERPPEFPSYGVSGTVSGATVHGVTVKLTGGVTASTVTDANGDYSFGALTDGTYTVTPSLAGCTFTPEGLTVLVHGASVTGRNFTCAAGAPPKYSISGSVSGVVAAGVAVALSGAASAATVTDASGVYSFGPVPDGSYTVTPALGSYAFEPARLEVIVQGANVTGQDFASATCARGTCPCGLPWGGTLPSGQSVTAYRSSSASCGTTCASETRACDDGVLNGSFTESACSPDPGTPAVSVSATDGQVPEGSAITLTWTSTCATACVASGGWSGSKALAGSEGTSSLDSDTTFTLTCSNAARQAQGSAGVKVRPWVDAVGEGASGETCNAWLARTGQAGLMGSVPRAMNYQPDGTLNWATEGHCIYAVDCDGGGIVLPVLAADSVPTGNPCAQAQQKMVGFRPVSAYTLIGWSYRTQTRR